MILNLNFITDQNKNLRIENIPTRISNQIIFLYKHKNSKRLLQKHIVEMYII